MGDLGNDALVEMAGCDEFDRVDHGVFETEALIVGVVFCQFLQQGRCDSALARGLGAVDDQISARRSAGLQYVSSVRDAIECPEMRCPT